MICTRLLFDQGNNPIDKVKVGYFKQLQIKNKSFGYISSGNLRNVIVNTKIDYRMH